MVIFGGLELVAAGYLVHRHQKNKKEKERLETEAAQIERQYQEQQRHKRRQKASYSRPHYSSKQSYPQSQPPQYHQPKPGYYSPQQPQVWRPQKSHVDISQAPVSNGFVYGGPRPQQGWTYPYAQQPSQPVASLRAPTQGPRYSGPYSSARPHGIASTPNLPHGYQSNTGLSDDSDRLSMDGLEVHEPARPHSPHVHFAVPGETHPGDNNDPPPPYRP